MKIGVAGPIALDMLAHRLQPDEDIPQTYRFAPVAYWVEELIARGHTISVFALSTEIQQPLTLEGDNLTIHVGRYRQNGRARDFFSKEREDLLDAMQADPCDVIHAHWTYEFALAALASGQPTLVTAHDAPLQVLRIDRSPYRFMRMIMAQQVARKAPYMTAVSPYVERHFQRYLHYRGNLTVVHNGLPESVFRMANQGTTNPQRNGSTFATVLQGWGGRKNGQVALEAFQLARERNPEHRMLMFGSGHGVGEAAEQWATRRSLTEGVTFNGSVAYDELIRTLASEVDILVHPSLEEALPMSIAEAMAVGLPVIGGRTSGGVPYMVDHQVTGLLVNPRNEHEMASAMLDLASNVELREEMGRAGRSKAENEYRLSHVTDQFEDLYDQSIRSFRR